MEHPLWNTSNASSKQRWSRHTFLRRNTELYGSFGALNLAIRTRFKSKDEGLAHNTQPQCMQERSW